MSNMYLTGPVWYYIRQQFKHYFKINFGENIQKNVENRLQKVLVDHGIEAKRIISQLKEGGCYVYFSTKGQAEIGAKLLSETKLINSKELDANLILVLF